MPLSNQYIFDFINDLFIKPKLEDYEHKLMITGFEQMYKTNIEIFKEVQQTLKELLLKE